MRHRIFVSQEQLDAWISEGDVEVGADVMTDAGSGMRFRLQGGLLVINELSGNDVAQIVGKVQDMEQIRQLGGEHVADSLLVGDSAYTVKEGFIAELLQGPASSATEKTALREIVAFFAAQ